MAANATKTYLEYISEDEKKREKEQLELVAQESALELNRKIFEISSLISKKKGEIERLKRQIPYSVIQEYIASRDLKDLEAKKEFALAVKEERFKDLQQ